MKIAVRRIGDDDCEPSNDYEIESRQIYNKIMSMYKKTGECPYCGSSVTGGDNQVIDGGWYNDLKCSHCWCVPPLRPTIHYEILKKVMREITI